MVFVDHREKTVRMRAPTKGDGMIGINKSMRLVLLTVFLAAGLATADESYAQDKGLTKQAHAEIEQTALAMDPPERLKRAAMAVEDIYKWEQEIKKLMNEALAEGDSGDSKAQCIEPNLKYIGLYLKTARQEYTKLKSQSDSQSAAHHFVLIAAQQQAAKGYAQAAQICTGSASFGEDTKQSWWKDEDVHPVDDLVLATDKVLPPQAPSATINPQTTTPTLTPNGG